MWRFLLPAFFAMTVALILLFAGVRGDAQSAPGVSERVGDIVGNAAPSHASPPLPTPAPSPFAQGPTVSGVVEQRGAPAGRDERAIDLRRPGQRPSGSGRTGWPAARPTQGEEAGRGRWGAAVGAGPARPRGRDLQRQDAELHNELQGLITQLEQELQLEEQSPPAADASEQQQRQAARDALKHEIADLRRQDNECRADAHRGKADVAQGEPEAAGSRHRRQKPTVDDTLEASGCGSTGPDCGTAAAG